MKKLISMLIVCSMLMSMMWCTVPAKAIELQQIDKPFEVTFDYDLSHAKVYPDCDIEIYKTSECKETTDKAYARDMKTGDIDISGNGDIVFHVSVSPWSWFEVEAKGDYDEVEYGDYNFVKIIGIKSDLSVTIKVGDEENCTDTDDSDKKTGEEAGHSITFKYEDGITIMHDGKAIGNDGVVYLDDKNTNSESGDEAKKDLIFSIKDDRDSSVGLYINAIGEYKEINGITGENEESINDILYNKNYDYYKISGITGDLTVYVGFEYPCEGTIAGYSIEFITNGITVICDDNIINNNDTVYTDSIILFGFREGKKIWYDEAEKKDFTFMVKNASPSFLINGEYDDVSNNGDGIYTIEGITGDLSVEIYEEEPSFNTGVVAGYRIDFVMPENYIVKQYSDFDFDERMASIIQNGQSGQTGDIFMDIEESPYPKDYYFSVESGLDIDSVDLAITGDYKELKSLGNSEYIITNVTSNLKIQIETTPEENILEGHKITFNFDKDSYRVFENDTSNQINDGDTVHTSKINTKIEESPYPKDYKFIVYCNLGFDEKMKISVKGDYEELIQDSCSYTIKGIKSDISLDFGIDKERKGINDALRKFSSEFFKHTYQKGKEENVTNMIVSPLSLYTDLAMLENGTANKTQEEILNMLTNCNDRLSENTINEYVKRYMKEANKDKVLHIANSVYISNREDIRVNPDYVDKVNDYYNADVFRATPDDATVNRINKWCYDNTNGAIRDVLKPGSLSEDTNSILINAVAFDGEWTTKFQKDDIQTDEFTNYNGSKTNVEFLCGDASYYYDDDKALAFKQGYKGNYSFLAILPNEDVGIDKYISEMDENTIRNLLNNGCFGDVHTKIPKFEFAGSYELKDTLKSMGMVEAFDGNKADLSRLAPSEIEGVNTFVSDVQQITHVKLDENGTKAEAVTIINDTDCSTELDSFKQVYIYLDRPFIFMIYDDENNLPIFVGTVGNMSNDDNLTKPKRNDIPDSDDISGDAFDVVFTTNGLDVTHEGRSIEDGETERIYVKQHSDTDEEVKTDFTFSLGSGLTGKTKIIVTGDYDEIVDNGDGTYTIKGIKSRETVVEVKLNEQDSNNEKPQDPGDNWLGLLGDVNGDSKISAKDSLLIQKHAINIEKLDEVEQKLADVDGNGKVTNADAMHILRYTIHSKVAYNIGDGIYRDYKDTPDIPLDILLPYTRSVY